MRIRGWASTAEVGLQAVSSPAGGYVARTSKGSSRTDGTCISKDKYRGVRGALEEFVRQLLGSGGGVGALLWLVGAGHYTVMLEREEMRTVRSVAQATEAQLEAAGVLARGARVRILHAARGILALIDGLGQTV